jgi:hypothetical protein
LNLLTYRNLGRLGRLGLARRLQSVRPVFPPWDYQHVFNVPPEWFVHADELALAIDAPDIATDLDPTPRHYLQHLPYLDAAGAEIRAAFTLTDWAADFLEQSDGYHWLVDLEAQPGIRTLAAVHVRRGDTLRNPPGTLKPLGPAYFEEAIAQAKAAGATDVVAFTEGDEGRGWVERNVPAVDIILTGPERPVERYETAEPVDWVDMLLMARCDMHVLSNATYGWWGAWLADGGPVWYPDPWFGPLLEPEHRANQFTYPQWHPVPAPLATD